MLVYYKVDIMIIVSLWQIAYLALNNTHSPNLDWSLEMQTNQYIKGTSGVLKNVPFIYEL
jgi:hypothetical protein